MSEDPHRGPPDDSAARRRDMLAALAVIAAVVAVAAGRRLWQAAAPRPSEAQCAALLDRYVEHASRAGDPALDDDDVARAREDSRGEPERLADVRACREELTATQVECGVRSPNVDELERCLQ